MTAVVIEEWRPLVKNTLRGFCRVQFVSGLVIDDIAIHVGSADGRAWCSPPRRPMLDEDGAAIRDEYGKVKYVGLIGFTTNSVRESWQRQIIAAVRQKYPGALSGIASAEAS
jgi:hypothetical protein